jgi:hypothetical protein
VLKVAGVVFVVLVEDLCQIFVDLLVGFVYLFVLFVFVLLLLFCLLSCFYLGGLLLSFYLLDYETWFAFGFLVLLNLVLLNLVLLNFSLTFVDCLLWLSLLLFISNDKLWLLFLLLFALRNNHFASLYLFL